MLNHLPEDMIPCWDYDFVTTTDYKDASASVISACGMLDMASQIEGYDKETATVYRSAAAQLTEAVIDKCTTDNGFIQDGLIHHVSHALPQKQGFNECAVYGDYFYLEVLTRYLKPDWKRYW